MIELKPCPFCGGEANFREDEKYVFYIKFKAYSTLCIKCGASTRAFDHKEEATEAWNRRTDDDR